MSDNKSLNRSGGWAHVLNFKVAGRRLVSCRVTPKIELNSPSNKSCEICPTRRTIQSCVEIAFFPLDKCGFSYAVTNRFRNYRERDKFAHERGEQ